MTKLTLTVLALALALTAACGDNLEADTELERGDVVIIIPNPDQVIDALESAELAGFKDPIYFEDAGYISAVGDLSIADGALRLPGIADVLPADALDDGSWNDRVVWDRDQAFDLGATVVDQSSGDYLVKRSDWNDDLAAENVPASPDQRGRIDWSENLARR
jgi:hypothetical protein